ncbi:MAG: helix-turn-helix domain-containing protein [Phycisphaera sp.]|nr:helix-turn-helix domain-containing protein [Phycisphaera sp.]
MEHNIKRVLFAAPWWHEDLMQGIARHAAAHGWHLNLDPALSGRLPEKWNGDGILTNLGSVVTELERLIQRAGCPAVSLSLNHPHIPIPRVGIDNKIAGQLAADHFLERGFTSFAMYGRSDQHAGNQRYKAYAEKLATFGHTVTRMPDAHTDLDDLNEWTTRHQLLCELLRQLHKPVAVFAVDDASAVEVIEACQTIGLKIPDDVGVLGMLDMPLFRHSTTIPLSSVTVDFDTQTRIACDLLDSMMDGQPHPPPDKPILIPPTGIATRASTDTIAAQTPGVARAIRYMLDHYPKPIGLPDLVRASGMSQSRLYAAFHKDTSQSPVAVLTRIRLDKAKRVLVNSDKAIDNVATDCGFKDRINLYRQFKQHLGLSPGQYRQHHRDAIGQ